MVALLIPVFTFIANALIAILRHPFVTKMMIFAFFLTVIHYGITFIVDLVRPYLATTSVFSLASALGIFDAIQIYITIIIAGWSMKQILSFVRS